MYRTTSVMALGLFLGLAPVGALAQTQTDTDTQQQELMQPSESEQSTETEVLQSDDQQSTETEVLQSDDQQSTETEVLQSDDQQATETETLQTDEEVEVITKEEMTTGDDADVAQTEDVIPEQDPSEMLASTLMGAPVNLADEEIGSVSDLIIGDDYSIRGVVVGVGGFLGIGEKRVALPMNRITVQTAEPGQVELATDMTREELEQKEAFKTAAQAQSEREAEQARQQLDAQQPVEPAAPQQ
jgi:hypothetical protein